MTLTISMSPSKPSIKDVDGTKPKLYEDFIPIPRFFYWVLGFTPHTEETSFIRFMFWLNFVNNCGAVMGQIIFLRNVIEANASFIDSTALFGCICFGSDNNVKLMMTIWRKKPVLKQIYLEFAKLYPKTLDKQSKYNFKSYEVEWKMASGTYYFLLIFHNIFFCLFPFIHSTFNYYTEDVFLYRTPLFVWYPFNITEPFWWYLVIYVHQAYCVLATTMTTLGFALLFGNIVLQTDIHYEYISEELKQLPRQSALKRSRKKEYETLRDSVIMHQNLFRLCDQINDAFGFSLFYYITNVTISICCLGIQVAGGASIFIIGNYTAFFAFQLVQLFIFCAMGEKLIQVSENVSGAAYSGIWVDASAAYKKSILIIMSRAQKPAEIKGGGFFLLSFETFRRVISFSYQVFALLLKMLKN